MARTKKTVQKNTGGKPLAMGRGKATPKKNPPPGKPAERKVVVEYSSDEKPQQTEGAAAPKRVKGAAAPKRVKKQIHVTLPTSPAHVTTTESFTTFFINHGLTRALQKAFAKRGWSTDQMREFVTNFQKKHGQQVPMPKIYGDEDTSEEEGIELADGARVAKKTAGGAGGSGGANLERSQQPAAVLVLVTGAVHRRAAAQVQVVQAVPEARSEVVTAMMTMMTPTNAGRPGVEASSRNHRWLVRNHARKA